MVYVISAVVGVIYGIAAGLIKYVLVWRRFIRPKKNAEEIHRAGIFVRMALSHVLNAVILLVVFLIRDMIPLDFVVTIVAAAAGLAISGRLFSTKKFSGYLIDQASQNTL